ncbi:MAG: bifunctional diaminohydroxyphosphoribosylaminopyrimidine deaminase/5-amino-6-(5-phosphoribosylamino)uracil reductase RibD [Gammaproteobacteria bacterium]|nr:bifunctional diaminohydroxyphosphoribosylaminopyrimidine deaminase/5-amino-6-(5-phosphoribosylamino)uracil reductase RibD [Gammaproteobacteria bacterium]
MARALALARTGWYSCRPNPRVGCVLVRDGEIVAEGSHLRAGEAHAERHALARAGAAARGATCYVTLEPCCHHGRTPPCTEALLAAGVARVVYARRDPNPAVAGGGAAMLRAAGVPVDGGLLAAVAANLNPGYESRMCRGRPWVRLKIAMSLDGKAALASGASQWLTGPEARADVQRLRAEAGAVLTGIGTVLADDPALTVRDARFDPPDQPLRIVLDSQLRMPLQAKMLGLPGRTLIGTTSAEPQRRAALEARGAEVHQLAAADGKVDPVALLTLLGTRQINDVLVEAGPTLAARLLELRLVDELVLYVAPRLLGAGAREALPVGGITDLLSTPWLEIVDDRRIGCDWRLLARPTED